MQQCDLDNYAVVACSHVRLPSGYWAGTVTEWVLGRGSHRVGIGQGQSFEYQSARDYRWSLVIGCDTRIYHTSYKHEKIAHTQYTQPRTKKKHEHAKKLVDF